MVEIDGSSHNDKQEYDASRQRYLEDLGVKVVRYTDIEVKRDIVSVMQHLSDYIDTIQQISPQTGETNHTLQARERNLPAFQAPLQRRGMMGYKSSGGKMVWNEELEKEIPEGWEVKELGNFIQSFSKSHDFKKKQLIFFNTSDILNGEFLHSEYMNVDEMPGQAKKSIKKDDILYSEIRPNNRRFALVRNDADDYVVSTKLMVLRRLNNELGLYRMEG